MTKENTTVWDKFCDRMLSLGFDHEAIKSVKNKYDEPHRFYHTFGHIADLLKQLETKQLYQNDVLFLATVYHDIVYDASKTDNEELSAKEFLIHAQTYLNRVDESAINQVAQIILETKTHRPTTELSRIFCEMDMEILKRPLNELIEYENQVFKEYQFYDYTAYKTGRIDFLKKVGQPYQLDSLIAYVEAREPKIALYPGSFNPFHKGHLNILLKAEKIFDKVIIARGINPGKEGNEQFELPALIKNRQLITYDNLLTDLIQHLAYPVTVIRGLRNNTDLQFELNQYRYLQDLTNNNINIISIFCDREFEHISSTGIRQLKKFGRENDYLL